MKYVNSKQSIWLVLTLAFLSLISVMNAVLFNIALDNISKDLAVSTTKVSWIVVGYSMGLATTTLIYGKFADYFQIKKLFIFGITLFLLGSALGFIKHESYTFIIIARLLQSFGGSSFITLSLISIRKMIQPAKRTLAYAFVSVGVGMAMGVGPLFGGVITDLFGWPYLFLFMLLSIVTLIPIIKIMPLEGMSSEEFSFDFIGAFLMFGVIASILLGANINPVFFVLFIIMLLLFSFWASKSKNPFININLFKNTKFLIAVVMGFIAYTAINTNIFVTPLFLGKYYELNNTVMGVIFFIGSIFSVTSSLITGKILNKQRIKKSLYLASTITLVSFLILGLFLGSNVIIISIAITLNFIAFSSMQVALNSLVPQILKASEVGVGLGVFSLTNNIGLAMGPAVASAILEQTQNYSASYVLMSIILVVNILLIYKFSFD